MKRMLVLAHREELIYQSAATARDTGLSVGIEMGNHRAGKSDVVVSTVQTQIARRKCRECVGNGCDLCSGRGQTMRMESFNPHDFGLVIVDEAHHATAKSYRLVLEYYQQNPELRVLLVTATPNRSDNAGLHNVCDSVAYEMDLRTAIDEGWLVPIRQQFVTVESLDLSRVGTLNGDLKDGELERAFLGESSIDEEKLLHSLAKPSLERAAGQALLVFASGCTHAEKLCAAFNAYPNVTAELVLGHTDKDERKRIVSRYKDGTTQVLVGVGCFVEGFDAPNTAVVAIARPTKSASLYLQMIGRATRPQAGLIDGLTTIDERRSAIAGSAKPHCVVLDFVGNSGKHKLISVGDVLAGDDVDPVDLRAALNAAVACAAPVDMDELIEKAKQAREEREERKRKQYEEKRTRMSTRHRADRVDYSTQDVDIFSGRRFDTFSDWQPKPWQPSAAQLRLLETLGVFAETSKRYTKRQAGAVIDKLKREQVGAKYRMPFGKHRGQQLSMIPSGYINWLVSSSTAKGDVLRHIQIMRGAEAISTQEVF